MVRGEIFQSGYAFPDELQWWCGENDLVLTVQALGGWCGMVHDARITHLDGQTGDWDDPEVKKQLQADIRTFEAQWSALRQGAA